MMQSLSIGKDHELFNFYHQYDHTILLGDLNYRIDHSPAQLLPKIASSAHVYNSHFKATMNGHVGCWRSAAYAKLWSVASANGGGSVRSSRACLYDPSSLPVVIGIGQQEVSRPFVW